MNLTLAQLILQDRQIAYALTDRTLRVVETGGAMDLFGKNGVSCLGRALVDLFPELVGSEDLLAEILAGKRPRLQLDWINREADGRTLYLTMVDLPLRSPGGSVTGLIHILQDTTGMGNLGQELAQRRNELRLLHDQLARRNSELAAANTELRRLDDLKSAFISSATHELRTPLSTIIGYLEMLLEENFGPLHGEQHEILAIIQGSARRLLTIVNTLLDITRIEAGRIELTLRPTDLKALVERLVAEFRPQLEARAQHLTLEAPPELPPALCDETRAMQIVSNLLSNASKYTPDGGKITIALSPAAEEGFLQLAVADTGMGISPDDQPHLFDRFFRTRTAVQSNVEGLGLGLYITRSLVELHRGRIWLESEPGRGSTFYVTFPVAGPAEDTLAPPGGAGPGFGFRATR